MGMRINTNTAAMNAYRNLSVNDSAMSKSLEKLSSGFRINRAADDAAGLAISEGMSPQIGGIKIAVRNTQDGITVVQTAEGALHETTHPAAHARPVRPGGERRQPERRGQGQHPVRDRPAELRADPHRRQPRSSTASSSSTATTRAPSRSAPTPARRSRSRSAGHGRLGSGVSGVDGHRGRSATGATTATVATPSRGAAGTVTHARPGLATTGRARRAERHAVGRRQEPGPVHGQVQPRTTSPPAPAS